MLTTRDKTKEVKVGNLKIGGGNPITVQSMTKTNTSDIDATVKQIHDLEQAGCQIVRCAVPDKESAEALKEIKKQINIPLVADKFGIDLFAPDTIATTVEEDSVNAMGEVVVDSTKQVALKWYNKSSEKISSLLNKKEKLTKKNVNK